MAKVEKLKIEYRDTASLVPYARNARTHSEAQVSQIAGSIAEFGFTNPILIDESGVIIAGHGRLAAAAKLQMQRVPCITLAGLTDTQRRALILADNRLAENAGWDTEMLRVELEELTEAGADLDAIGFDDDFLEDIIGAPEAETSGDTEPEEPPAKPVSRRGDVWTLGNHRLMCGDSTCAEDVAKLMGGENADMVFTDPPYNVDYASKNEHLNAVAPANRIQVPILGDAAKSDEDAGNKLWKPAFANMRKFAEPHCSIYCTMPQGGAHMMMMMMMAAASWQVKHELMWLKNNHVLGRADYNYKHEPIMYGWADTHKFYGKGAHTLSVWEIPKPQQSKLHPTMKPVELVENAILNSSADGDRIMDLFCGSGTTIIAAENTGRQAFGMELAPAYVDVCIKRWQEHTGKTATLDGKPWDEVAAERMQNGG